MNHMVFRCRTPSLAPCTDTYVMKLSYVYDPGPANYLHRHHVCAVR